MPVPAEEVRRRGDRIRRRRHALLAAGSALTVVAVVVPVFVLGGGDGAPDGPDPAPRPTVTDPVGTLSEANLLADEDTVYDESTAWRTEETTPGDGQSVFHPCVADSLGGLGATDSRSRTWSAESADDDPRNDAMLAELDLTESVALFDSERAAAEAADAIVAALEECSPSETVFPDYQLLDEPSAVDGLPVPGAADLYTAQLESVADPGGGGYVRVMHTGVVRSGDRVAVLTMRQGVQDSFPQPVQEMLPVAAQRLVEGAPGGGTDDDASGTNEPAASVPDDFPLDATTDDPLVRGEDVAVRGPGPGVVGARSETACGTELAYPNGTTPAPGRDLGYSVAMEDYDGRTIRAYPTAEDAVDQMGLLRDQLIGCEQDEAAEGLTARRWQSFSSDTGYDSVTFGWTYEATGDAAGSRYARLLTVVRVGSAILTVDWLGEWSPAEIAQVAGRQVDLAGVITPEMECLFTVDGC